MNKNKIIPMITIALILLSVAVLHQQTKPANAAVTPAIYCNPGSFDFTSPAPLTAYPKWNFSIYVSGAPDVQLVSIYLAISDPTTAEFTNYYDGFLCKQSAWTPSSATHFNATNIDELVTYNALANTYNATTPTQVFIIEMQGLNWTAGTNVNMTAYVSGASGDLISDGAGGQVAVPGGEAIYITDGTFTIPFGGQNYTVTATSNSTVSGMTFDQPGMALNFTTSGADGTTGYVNVTIPKVLLNASLTGWNVMLDNANANASAIINENSTHTFVYLNYSQSAHQIRIVGTEVIPEFPYTTILLTLLATTAMALVLIRKVHKKRWQTL